MLSRSMAIIGSSSMMSTSVATCAAISRPANVDQLVELGDVDVEDLRRFGRGKPFHRAEQKGLARQRA